LYQLSYSHRRARNYSGRRVRPSRIDGADPKALPATVGVDLGEQGYAVLRVVKVLPRDPAAGDGEAALRAQYARAWANAEALAYYDDLKRRYKVKITVPAVAASAAAG
ncbi:MAG: peptidyl-prolyl cis-trans isomerase, partial [Rubrivivax sp.]